MSRSWNGESLVNEFSALLGDTSTVFKSRVLGWLNDVILDIHVRSDLARSLVKGKKILEPEIETQSLEIEAPIAPEVELVTGGDLEAGTVVSFLVTFVQANGVETVAGEESEELTITETDKTVELDHIPTSPESLVTKRRVYMKVGDDPYYLHTEIDDNVTATLTVDAVTDSLVEPPDFESIRKISGNPYFEVDASNRLNYRDADQLRMLIEGSWSLGKPEYFYMAEGEITTYPVPANEMELSFNYYRNPFKLYNSSDSQPDLPVGLKPVLKAGVVALGYEFRERQGYTEKRALYEDLLTTYISKIGKDANVEYVIRDVYGDYSGREVN